MIFLPFLLISAGCETSSIPLQGEQRPAGRGKRQAGVNSSFVDGDMFCSARQLPGRWWCVDAWRPKKAARHCERPMRHGKHHDTQLASKTHRSSTMYVGWNQVMTRKSSDEFIAEVSRRRGTLLFDSLSQIL